MQIERFSRREDKTERMMSLRLLDKDTFPVPQHAEACRLFHLVAQIAQTRQNSFQQIVFIQRSESQS